MTLEQFLVANLWGIITGGIGLVFTVGAVYMAVKFSIKQVSSDITKLSTDMAAKDATHDTQLAEHATRLSEVEQKTAVLESRLDQSIKHIGEQISRIYDKMFGSPN